LCFDGRKWGARLSYVEGREYSKVKEGRKSGCRARTKGENGVQDGRG